jgi:lipopolysaccharide/colanic/teichoic acid biosynthesis glycosyltransferase
MIRLGTPGPALFWQDRIGRNGKLFKFVKFRTLYADAKKRWPELYAYDYGEDEVESLKYKTEGDPRVTPQGRWMRFTSVDELPNFWNLLTGEVALVGPRPEIPEMLPYYSKDELRKFSVRPGITGLAQISGRGRLDFKQVVAFDVDYVDRQSVLLDIRIMFLTIYKIVIRDGAF